MKRGKRETKEIIENESTSLWINQENKNEFVIKSIKDGKQYSITFNDDFVPNKNLGSDIASANYTRYKIQDESFDRVGPDMLMIQIKLTEMITNQQKYEKRNLFGVKRQENILTLADKKQFLRDHEKAILNMYPMPYLNQTREQCVDPLQSQELFMGRCEVDFYFKDSAKLEEKLKKYNENPEFEQKSTLAMELCLDKQEFKKSEIYKALQTKGLLRNFGEITKDFYNSSLLNRCFDFKDEYSIQTKALLKYLIHRKSYDYNHFEIVMMNLRQILSHEHTQDEMSEFFKLRDLNDNDTDDFLSFHKKLGNQKKITLSNKNEQLTPFKTNNILLFQQYSENIDQFLKEKCPISIAQKEKDPDTKLPVYSKEEVTPVEHSVVDFTFTHRQMKLYWLRNNTKEEQKPFNILSIPRWLQEINDTQKHQIETHQGLQQIIDYYFYSESYSTQKYYLFSACLWLFGFVVPFLYQSLSNSKNDDGSITACLTVCLIVNAYFFLIELIQVKELGLMKHMEDKINILDFALLMSFFVYFFVRINCLSQIIVPNQINSSEESIISRQFLAIFTALIFVGSSVRLFIYSRVNKDMAQTVRMCYKVVSYACPFSAYFFMWILIFTFVYMIIGLVTGGHADSGHDGDDYEFLSFFWGLFLYSYRTAIGDLESPYSAVWMKLEKKVGWKQNIMVYIIWIVWMIEQYYMLIVCLNFLIAIIGQVYDQDLALLEINDYSQECEMNLEADIVLRFFGLRKIDELQLLTSTVIKKKVSDEEDSLEGITKRMRTFQLTETVKVKKEISKVDKKVDAMQKEINSKQDEINSKQDEIRKEMQKGQEEIRKEMQKGQEEINSKIDLLIKQMKQN